MRFERLTFIEDVGVIKKNRMWKMRCDCGTVGLFPAHNVKIGNTKSCGCKHREYITSSQARYVKHGLINTPTYRSWISMKSRCKDKRRTFYGARGITYCERWESFENFLLDMGMRPDGTTLDRINPDGNYEPTNCRWAANSTQNNNRRSNVFLSHDNQVRTISEWALITGLSHATINARIKRGWPVEKALTQPVR